MSDHSPACMCRDCHLRKGAPEVTEEVCPYCGNEEQLLIGNILEPHLGKCSRCLKWGDWERGDVVVTEEMLDAGINALCDEESAGKDCDDALPAIFRAMFAVRQP